MDALSNLYPTIQIGSDGFQWWIGQVESKKSTDKKSSGRYKVRIVGMHPQTCDAVSSDDLPWAITMMPVTNPHIPGGVASVSDQLQPGVWVIGFFMDVDKQQPVIMGSIGQVAASTTQAPGEDPTPGEGGCKSFTTFLSPDTKNADQPAGDSGNAAVTSTIAGHTVTGKTKTDTDGNTIDAKTNQLVKAKEEKNTETNNAGNNWCIEIADTCGKDKDLTGTFTRLLGEMLYETQRNGGKLGTYLVGELSGELTDAIAVGQKYINKGIQVIRTFVASIKGFILEKLKAGIKDLVNFLLGVTPEGNSLSPVTKFFNDILASVGCQMEDLGNRIAAFLEDLLFGYLFEIYKAAACQVDALVEGILNKITSELQKLLDAILGPINAILGAIASAIDIIGDTLAYVLDILGINCSGPPKGCSKTTTICTDCATDKKEDFLDDLLNSITDDLFPVTGEDWSQYTCDDAYTGTTLPATNVSFVGGTQPYPQAPVIKYSINDVTVTEGQSASFTVTRSGFIDDVSSVAYETTDGTATVGVDYVESSGIIGFVAGETSKTIQIQTFVDATNEGQENFFVIISKDTPDEITAVTTKNIGKCTIKEASSPTSTIPDTEITDPSDPKPLPYTPPNILSPNDPRLIPTTPEEEATVSDGFSGTEQDPTTKRPTYKVTADKNTVREGEFITFLVETTNVPNGTILPYNILGVNITADDIIGGALNGTVSIENNAATVVVGITEDAADEFSETLIFGIPGTSARDSVLILGELDDVSLDDKLDSLDDSSSIDENDGGAKKPTVGTIITDAGGGIIEVPIDNPGTPYVSPPYVIITGNGTGATGIALLDSDGFVSEIRITNPGKKYKLNLPQQVRKECIIDSFTLLNTGRGYKTAPTVYVDGDKNVAEAIINSDGLVISVRIKNRSIVFDRYPEILILGGGGYGAKAIPSLVCLDPDDRVTIGSAKIGTGKYIDCP